MYIYRVQQVVRVVDGDSYDLLVAVGFHMTFGGRFRLAGFDTPELRKGDDFERAEAKRARDVAQAWFDSAAPETLFVSTEKSDSFGRWLAAPWTSTEQDGGGKLIERLGDHLRDKRLASQWPTRWREEFGTGQPPAGPA